MKKLMFVSIVFLFQITILFAQNLTVTGKLVDQNMVALSGYTVIMYINPDVYTTTSATDGKFTFFNVTDVGKEQLPSDYTISNNYPNPFNPLTRIEISLPKAGRVKIELFNTIGERVQNVIEKEVTAGNSYFDLELAGMPNGIYLAKINIDNKYTVIRKLMLLYGSQHLSASNANTNIRLEKLSTATKIDSIVVSWAVIGKKTFTNLPDLVDGTLDLGNLVVEQASLSGIAIYANTTIPVSGVLVSVDGVSYTTGPDGIYQLNALSPGTKTLNATKTGYDPYSTTIGLNAGVNSHNIEMTSALFTFNLYGTIVEATTLQPIQGVLVTVLNGDGTPSNLQTYSDFLGYYQIPTVPQGQRTVTFVKENYTTHSAQLFISNSNYQYNVGLNIICPPIVTDTRDGKVYNTVLIGEQCWLQKNLDVGTMILGNQSASTNGTIEKHCYNDDSNNCNIYGGLYQWNEAMQYVTYEGAQGICPPGWHIPTQVEFETLQTTVNNDGNALKAIGEGTGDGTGTNTSGFSALLAGYRTYFNSFTVLGEIAAIWTSTEIALEGAKWFILYFDNSEIPGGNYRKTASVNIRCLKN